VRKRISFKRSQVAGPPSGEAWIWHSVTLLRSMAWRRRPIGLMRLLDFLEIEHCAHGGNQNGDLLAPFDQLVKFGIRRQDITKTIKEGERRGLLRVERGKNILGVGKREPSRFLLTYLPRRRICEDGIVEWLAPSDEWRKYRPSQIQKPSAGSGTNSVPEPALGTATKSRKTAKN
jgi:hypothetical protein